MKIVNIGSRFKCSAQPSLVIVHCSGCLVAFRRSTWSFPDLETKTFPSKFRFNLVRPIIEDRVIGNKLSYFPQFSSKLPIFTKITNVIYYKKQASLIMHLNCDSLKNLKIFNFEGSGKYSSSYYNVIFLGILWRQLLPRKTRQEIAIAHRFFARSDNDFFEFQSNICFRHFG